ncbi:U3 small nucleolar RNA-associated protein 4 homolog [Drosophila grimshawi]|uniref:GH15625 n=1 Tax=Drosophila grimshawi TaxID=7222 RepID=B4J0B0_DROGR|nr:U3 small nucleolar RNA-associated protein 4 homolog [Drosophila grimshawi]EDV95711.1 GH15625 [Drosophila grimshawi]
MKENTPDKPDGTALVHNVRFYTIKPRAIVCLAYSKVLKCLALSREDGSIELWDMNYAPYLDRVIQLTSEAQVECLAWAGKRLFSVDLNGKLIEWDLNKLQPRYEQSPTGNALWCLDVNSAETELAVGSEEGHINIMSIEHDEISYKMLFNKQDGRVLCCKFDKPGKRLVTGSMGAVRIWSVARGNTLHTMTLSSKEVIVYSLQVLSDNTIIAGDSAGFVTVWDASNAAQLETCKVLDKSVFALALNEQEDRLVCSGLEPPLIRVLSKTQIKRDDSVCERWIKFLQRDAHRHYVKALVMINDRIVSGGEDGILCISSSNKARAYVARYAPFIRGPCASLANKANLLLLRYPQSLHLWRLGLPRPDEHQNSKLGACVELQLGQTPEKLLQLNVGDSKFIQAAAISQDNAWICYSTGSELRLSHLQLEPKLSVQRLTEDLPAELEGAAIFIAFAKSDQLFILHAASCQLRCFSLQQRQVEFLYSIDLSTELKSPISHVELSSCGKYLVVATTNHLIAVWQLRGKSKQSRHLLNLPRYKAGTTALALGENSPRLVVAYTDGRIVDYDLVERRFVCETDQHFMPNADLHCIKGIQLDALNPNIIIVYNEVYLYVLESYQLEQAQDHAPNNKAKRLSRSSRAVESTKLQSYRLKMSLTRQHLAQVCRLSPKELVTIGVQTKNLLAPLPPPFQRKMFGAS